MRIAWNSKAWEEYLYWQANDRAMVRRINRLLDDIVRDPESGEGLGKPEILKGMGGARSRRIDTEHRLVYVIEDDLVVVQSCRYHY